MEQRDLNHHRCLSGAEDNNRNSTSLSERSRRQQLILPFQHIVHKGLIIIFQQSSAFNFFTSFK